MNALCKDRVVIVTGAGRGIGRDYALEFARQGAKVVVNDLGKSGDGSGDADGSPAEQVVAEIRALGGTAIDNAEDVADWDGARRMVDAAVTEFGRLDVLVNNAGILRDRTIANMSIEEWDSVIRVHLRGTFAPSHWASVHWREESKRLNGPVGGRLINTSSSSGLYANAGQANYAAAKAGIASFTVVASRELARYGVTANAIYPTALSRLTEDVFRKAGYLDREDDADQFDPLAPSNVAPVVVWLGSEESSAITGRVFGVRGSRIVVAEGWVAGPTVEGEGRWDAGMLGEIIPDLVGRARRNSAPNGSPES